MPCCPVLLSLYCIVIVFNEINGNEDGDIKTILLTNNSMVKISAFARIYLLTSKMCCNLLKGNSYLFLLK